MTTTFIIENSSTSLQELNQLLEFFSFFFPWPHGVRKFQVKSWFPGNAQKLTYVVIPQKAHIRDRFTLLINKIPLDLGKQTSL